MFPVLLGVLICSVLGILASVVSRKKISMNVGCGAGVPIGVLLGGLAAIIITSSHPTATWKVGTWKLAALRTVDDTQGVFLFGTGGFGGQTVYKVLIKRDDGSYSPYSVTADSATRIREDAALSDEGEMIIWATGADPKWRWAKWAFSDHANQWFEFHVPAGSVRASFSVR